MHAKNKKYRRLRRHIFGMCLFVSSFLLILLLIYTYVVRYELLRLEKKHLGIMADTLNVRLDSQIDDMKQDALMISSSRYAHQYLDSDVPADRYVYATILGDAVISAGMNSHTQIIDLAGHSLSFHAENHSIVQTMIKEYDILVPGNLQSGITNPIFNTYDKNWYVAYYAPIFDLNTVSKIDRKAGTCLVLFPLRDFSFQEVPYAGSDNQFLYVESSSRESIWFPEEIAAEQSTLSSLLHNALTTNTGFAQGEVDGQPVIGYAITNTQTSWNVLLVTPLNQLYQRLNLTIRIGVLSMLVCMISLFLLAYRLDSDISRPIQKMTAYLASPPDVIMNEALKIQQQSEISDLAEHINNMLLQIELANKKIRMEQAYSYQVEIRQQSAQIEAMQKQMNPHFLFNTLNTIQGYAYEYQAKEIVSIIESLSSLLRYNLRSKEFAAFREELNSVQDYMAVINWRYSNSIELLEHIPEFLMEKHVPRFLLQPLVENAVHHGFEPTGNKGAIHIDAAVHGNVICIQVKNTASSLEPDKLLELNKLFEDIAESASIDISANNADETGKDRYSSHGTALRNIQQRIRLLYGKGWKMSIENDQNMTVVSINLPYEVKS